MENPVAPGEALSAKGVSPVGLELGWCSARVELVLACLAGGSPVGPVGYDR